VLAGGGTSWHGQDASVRGGRAVVDPPVVMPDRSPCVRHLEWRDLGGSSGGFR
jgi:hypothetical protein